MPDLAEVHMGLGNVLFSRDDLASAVLEYRKVIQLDAESASARIALALVLSRTNRSPEAASLLQEVLVRDPANQQIRQLLEQIKSGALQAR